MDTAEPSQTKEKNRRLRPKTSVRIPVAALSSQTTLENIENANLPEPEDRFLRTLMQLAHSEATHQAGPDYGALTYVDFTLDTLSRKGAMKGHRGFTKRSLRDKCENLVEAGVFSKRILPRPENAAGTNASLYVLEAIHKDGFETKHARIIREMAGDAGVGGHTTNRYIARKLMEDDYQLIVFDENNRSVTEGLYTGVADMAMRISTNEKVPGQMLRGQKKLDGVRILVESTTSTHPDAELAALSDQRITRAFITEIANLMDEIYSREMLKRGFLEDGSNAYGKTYDRVTQLAGADPDEIEFLDSKSLHARQDSDLDTAKEQSSLDAFKEASQISKAVIKNDFYIDTIEVARRCGYTDPTSGSTRRSINFALMRHYDTRYSVSLHGGTSATRERVRKKLGMQDDATNLRLITSMKSQTHASFWAHRQQDAHDTDDLFAALEYAPQDRATEESMELEIQAQNRRDGDADRELTDQEIGEAANPYDRSEMQRIRFWKVSIDPDLFDRLLDQQNRRLYTAHPEIMENASGLGQTLYNFVSSIIGRTAFEKIGGRAKVYDDKVGRLQQLVWSIRKYKNFNHHLLALLKQAAKTKKIPWDETLKHNRIPLFGYIFTLEDRQAEQRSAAFEEAKQEPGGLTPKRKAQILRKYTDGMKDLSIRIERDPKDKYNGDDSPYNRKLIERYRKNLAEQEKKEKEKGWQKPEQVDIEDAVFEDLPTHQ